MKKVFLLLLLGGLAYGGYWAYDRYVGFESPSEAYTQMTIAAQLGDEEAFLDGFTDDSRKIVAAFLRLAESYEIVRDEPYKKLVLAEVVGERFEEKGDERTAYVSARYRRKTIEVPMVRENGKWKVDAFELEQSWFKRRR